MNESWHTYGETKMAHQRMSESFDESLRTYVNTDSSNDPHMEK